MEFEYAAAARVCGIEMPEARLFASSRGPGYFGVKRFDRVKVDGMARRVHMASVSGLLETSHRIPNLDYLVIAKLTLKLTGSIYEVERLYRLMCFNVLAHNRDDHSKNFAFVFDRGLSAWHLAPAYDLTLSAGMGGEHATTVNGKGASITQEDLVACGVRMGLPSRSCRTVAGDVREGTELLRDRWVRRGTRS
jgi:serine/threonine-protein kinase HipA